MSDTDRHEALYRSNVNGYSLRHTEEVLIEVGDDGVTPVNPEWAELVADGVLALVKAAPKKSHAKAADKADKTDS